MISSTSFDPEDKYGLNSRFMGIPSKKEACAYCGCVDCSEHYGMIDFKGTFVYNPCFIKYIPTLLNCICASCGNIIGRYSVLEDAGILRLPFSDSNQSN